MKNPASLTREQNLQNWSEIIYKCQSAKAKDSRVRDWLEAHNIPHDTYYYYWYAEVRNALLDEVNPGQYIIPYISKYYLRTVLLMSLNLLLITL